MAAQYATTTLDDALQAPNPRTSRQLFRFGLAALGCGLLWLTHTSPIEDPILLAIGNIVAILGTVPALNWARRGLAHFPVFEMFMLTSIPFYSVSLLSGHPEVLDVSDEATFQAGFSIILFQGCAIISFFGTRGRPSRSRFLTITLLPDKALRYAQAGIWITTAYLFIQGFTTIIPHELATPFRAMFVGIGTVSLFIEARRWGARQLHSAEKIAITFNLTLQIVFLFRELYLISGISILLLALIGFVSTSRRIPVFVIAAVLPLIAVLHNGKASMRVQYWENHAPAPTLTELPGFFERWFDAGLHKRASGEQLESSSLAGRLFERASLFQMLCLVTERTPELDPFLAGESYKYIPAQIIPSFLWPDKPSSLLSNVLLAVHYGLVSEDDPTSVSIAFGMVAEAYANFGTVGCAVLGLLLGYAYKRVSVAALGCPQFSALGLFTILLAAWSFQVEQIFATWLVSLFQAAIVVIGLPLCIRILFQPE